MFNSISRSQLDDAAALRLVCFPYAGGGTAGYHRWRPLMPDTVDLVPVSLPGHDGRLNEALYTDIKALANALREDLSRFALDKPFVLLGHSMGAVLAFEIARSLRRHGQAMPRLMVLTGCPPPHLIVITEPLHKLPDDELMEVLQSRYGGIPAVIRENPELWKLLAPPMRADFEMIDTYRYDEEPPLDVPMLVLGGAEDAAVSAAKIMDWRKHTTQDCSVRLLPGNHFFLFSAAPANDEGGQPAQQVKRDEPTPGLRVILERLEQCATEIGSGDG
ncbi:MAG: alpha/beta fold hydrolase [Pirellulales bacterium]